jgi:hypothetical protein
MTERFAVGDAVTYHDGIIGTTLNCRIIKVMPSDTGAGLYHIRDLAESFERAVSGNTLTRIKPDNAGGAAHFKTAST